MHRRGVIFCVLLASVFGADFDDEKIINGSPVTIDKSPFLAAFEARDNLSASFSQECGSVIVDSLHLITAAHCLVDYKTPNLMRIRVGTSLLEEGGSLYNVAQFWTHPKYKVYAASRGGTYLDYDIGVIRLATPLKFGGNVQAAKLIPLNQQLAQGVKVIAVGWGVLKYDGPEPKQLRRGLFSVVPQPLCNQRIQKLLNETVFPRFTCTEVRSNADCFGDSGGPVYKRDKNDNAVAGIISWGTCVGFVPNVVTDVANSEIRSFIREKTNSNI
ncbi:hypothetical protein FOCC_FOCC015996 [Frankliniella occidentalis]|uniref:Trypsin, alkaline C-like n=1 Tax=Frankliniella occidentalis TaxID=133901 RepID=A0A6J1TKA3_FRAOC|nr:trypsin, alkaline C-like [Frankliniella occidentalis]KAE8738520.1 hypothetical protein FOCC_FOCC015996 [Frankliniella occidentalis]